MYTAKLGELKKIYALLPKLNLMDETFVMEALQLNLIHKSNISMPVQNSSLGPNSFEESNILHED